MLSVEATLAQLLAILLSLPSGSPFSDFAPSAGVAGKAGLCSAPFPGVTGAEWVNSLLSFISQAQDCVMALASCAVAPSGFVSPSFDVF